MAPRLLILGGTTEATALARAAHAEGVDAVISLAGRVERPASQPIHRRIGGFGGVPGLAVYLRENAVTHVVDATHPFAAQMSRNAIAACAEAGVALLALTRPPWRAEPGDDWRRVADLEAAVAALAGPPRRVMLAIGRQHLAAFAAHPQHFYLLRLVDAPETPPPFPDHHVVVSRGPFDLDGDRRLMTEHAIDLVVSKNAGGRGAHAKIEAARALGLPVLMIERPSIPPRPETGSVEAAMAWVLHGAPPPDAVGSESTERGV